MRFPTLSEVREALRSLFSEAAGDQRTEGAYHASVLRQPDAADSAQKDRQLARLKEWMAGVVADLTEILAQPPEADGFLRSFAHATNIDATVFSKEDLLTVAPEYEALHDLCLKYDTALDFAGFDRLPRRGMTSTNHSWSRYPEVVIEVNRARTYNCMSHPRYLELKQAGVDLHISRDRPQAPACGLS